MKYWPAAGNPAERKDRDAFLLAMRHATLPRCAVAFAIAPGHAQLPLFVVMCLCGNQQIYCDLRRM
jgi:hypothetical protein